MEGARAVLVSPFSVTFPRPWDSDSFHEGLHRDQSGLAKFSNGDVGYPRVLSKLCEISINTIALIAPRFFSQGMMFVACPSLHIHTYIHI